MGTDYDSWLLNIVEGNDEEPCEDCGCFEGELDEDCTDGECGCHGDDGSEDAAVAVYEARMEASWDRFVADL